MTIYLALNEEFKAAVQVLKVADFKEKVKCLTDDRQANHTAIRKEFEVYKNCPNSLFAMYYFYEISKWLSMYNICQFLFQS